MDAQASNPADAARFTIIGGKGLIGRNLVAHLSELGHSCWAPERGEPRIFDEPLGHVVYAAGVTGDFRLRTFDTVRAHVCDLLELLERARFDSLLYLSTTRVYGLAAAGDEDAALPVSPLEPGDVYTISKLMGESICLAGGMADLTAVRLSNVYGGDFSSPNFLDSIVRDAVDRGCIVLRSHPASAKDYVSIDEVVDLLTKITLFGRRHIYNLASGVNVTNQSLVERLREITGCAVEIQSSEDPVVYPNISINRICAEFGFAPSSVIDALDGLVETYRERASRS